MSGTSQGYLKYKERMIAELASEEAFKEFRASFSSKGGKKSKGNFKTGSKKTKEAARKGGLVSKPNKILIGYDENRKPLYVDKYAKD